MAATNNGVYLESFIESTSCLPPELLRIYNLMKSLDEKCEEIQDKMAQSQEQLEREHRGLSHFSEDACRVVLDEMEEDHRMLMHFAEEKYALAQQAFELLQVHYLELMGDIKLLKKEIKEQGGDMENYEEPVPRNQPEARRPSKAKDSGIKRERPAQLTRVHSVYSNPSLTPTHPSPSPSPHISAGDLSADPLVIPDPLMPIGSRGVAGLRLEDTPISEDVLFQVKPPQGMSHSAKSPQAPGRLLTHEDISERLEGRQAELFWPDDNLWYLMQIHRVDVQAHSAQIIYTTGETEILNLDEIVQEGHMSLITLDAR